MNSKNLVKNSSLTPSERRERASKAGKASAEARRKKKTLRELLSVAMQLPSDGSKGKITNAEQMAFSMIEAAKAGDVKAFIAIRDTIGEKPVDKVEVGVADSLAEELGLKNDSDD